MAGTSKRWKQTAGLVKPKSHPAEKWGGDFVKLEDSVTAASPMGSEKGVAAKKIGKK